MIKKRILTDLFIRGIKFVDKETQKVIDLSSAEDLKLFVRRQSSVSMTWTEQTFELTSDGLVSFQWNATENVKLGIFDAMISYHKTSALSETGTIEYKYDVTDLFRIVPISEDEENVDDIVTVNAIYYGGADGLSAYQVAVKDGYVGTEAEWLASLKGQDGKDFKYSDFTADEIAELQKPAADAVANANAAAENANDSATACIATNKSVSDAETSRVTEFGSLKTASEYATSAATSAANAANNAASHAPKIVDGIWQVWDNSTQAYVSTGIKAVGADGITPQIRINSDTKNWETSVDGGTTWVNTGVSSISTNAEVVQVSGHETGKVISQKAVTDAILNSFDQLNFTIFENSDGSIYKKIFTTPLADNVSLGVDINSVSVYALPDMSDLTTLYYKFFNYNFTNFYAKIKTSDKLMRMDQILDGCVNLLSFDFTYFNTSNVTTLYYAMYGCINLKIIIGVINAKSVKTAAGFLDGCRNLEYFSGLAELKCSLYLKDCVKITHDSLISIIANLADMTTSDNQTWATNNNLTTTPTLTLGSTNLAKLTDAEKKVATDKGWILA